MPYVPFYSRWKSKPDPSTPVIAEALNHIDDGLIDAHQQLDGRLSDTNLNLAFVRTFRPTNTAAAQSEINAYLAATSGSDVVRRIAGEFSITGPIVIPSDSTVDFGNARITLPAGTNGNLLVNRAVVDNKRFTDAVMTSGSAVLTSAKAGFVAGDVGKAIRVQGAGTGGADLDATVASFQSATQITLSAPAATAVTAQYGYIGTRDKNISVRGGYWLRREDNSLRDGAKGLYGWSSNTIRFRHVDGLRIEAPRGETLSGKYFCNVGDVTRFDLIEVEGVNLNSDCVHVNGPASDGRILRTRSLGAGDDVVSLTGGDFLQADSMQDTCGDIIDVVIDTVRAHPSNHQGGGGSGGRAVLILAGQTSDQSKKFACRRITTRDVDAELIGATVQVGGDVQDVRTSSGIYDDILVDGVANNPTGTPPYQSVLLRDGTFGTIEIRSVEAEGSTRKVLVGADTTIDTLRLFGVKMADFSNNGSVLKLELFSTELPYGAARATGALRLQTMDRRLVSAPVDLTAGTVVFTYFRPSEGGSVTNLRNIVGTGADGATLCKAGLYVVEASGALTRLGMTSSSTSVWNVAASGQSKQFTLSAAVTLDATKVYATAHLAVGASPTLLGLKAGNAVEAGSDDILGKALSGQTDLPASVAKASLIDPPAGGIIYSRIW